MAPAQPATDRIGLIQAFTSFAIWGMFPLFFWLLRASDVGEVVASRVLWSLAFLILVTIALQRGPTILTAVRDPRVLMLLALSAACVSVNWLVYFWAVKHGQVLAASLGYFLNPLVNVLLGVVLLREKLTRAQGVAVAFATAGVSVLAFGAVSGLWISLALAFSFGFYGLVRKVADVAPFEGLVLETAILAPFAGGYMVWLSQAQGLSFGDAPVPTIALILSGVVTATPLILFASAAKRLTYSTLGLLQYLTPTLQFLLAISFFGETMSWSHIICFALIWTGLGIYGLNGAVQAGRRRAA
ncbi:MAG: EamA family transporter RarD [Alphaproteobacteria bacterium HGW-Alphaproteobacteria-16]|nr:MAG: EamA family transporter RarD [Alphaproteobacteria bacterium HGW-Alphaproteobacteria-16]